MPRDCSPWALIFGRDVLPVLVGHFAGDFDGGAAVVGVEDFGEVQAGGLGELDEALGEEGGGDVGEAQ